LLSMRSCRPPLVIRGRFRSSSQMETPRADSSLSGSLMSVTSCGLDGFPCCSHDCRRGETELTEQRPGVCRSAVVVNADDPAGVADEVSPAQWHGSLDAHPGPDCRR